MGCLRRAGTALTRVWRRVERNANAFQQGDVAFFVHLSSDTTTHHSTPDSLNCGLRQEDCCNQAKHNVFNWHDDWRVMVLKFMW